MGFFTRQTPELTLVEALRRGDPKAQRLAYDRYSPRMMALCRRYLADDFEAEEAMIEGFMRVFAHIGQFRDEGSFEGWIRRIMVNESLMALRRKKQEGFRYDYEEVTNETPPIAADTSLEAAELMALIDRLPTGYRTVFNLYAIEGYPHEEIAGLLGISENTSKSQLHRARVLLQKMLLGQEAPLSVQR